MVIFNKLFPLFTQNESPKTASGMGSDEKIADIIDSLNNVTSLVKSVYQSTWADFYTWEQDHCRRALHSLARPLPQEPSQEETLDTVASGGRLSNLSIQSMEQPTIGAHAEAFTVLDLNTEDGKPKASTLVVESYNFLPELASCPAYEICTPASRNINVGDDSEYMPFIPLMDDPKFTYDAHIAEYRYFEWQVPNRDPDCKFALRLLHAQIPTFFEWRLLYCRPSTNCTLIIKCRF